MANQPNIRRILEMVRFRVGDMTMKRFTDLALLEWYNAAAVRIIHEMPDDSLVRTVEQLSIVPQENPVVNADGSFGATVVGGAATITNPPANGNTNYTKVPIPAITGQTGSAPNFVATYTLPGDFSRPQYVAIKGATGSNTYEQIGGPEEYIALISGLDTDLTTFLNKRGFWWIADNRIYVTPSTDNTSTFSVAAGIVLGASPMILAYIRFGIRTFDPTQFVLGDLTPPSYQPDFSIFQRLNDDTTELLVEMTAQKALLALAVKEPQFLPQARRARENVNRELEALWARAGTWGYSTDRSGENPAGRI